MRRGRGAAGLVAGVAGARALRRRGGGAGAFGCVAFGVEAELLRRLAVKLAGLIETVLRLVLLQRGAGLLAVDAIDLALIEAFLLQLLLHLHDLAVLAGVGAAAALHAVAGAAAHAAAARGVVL